MLSKTGNIAQNSFFMKYPILFFISFLFSFQLCAQVTGVVTDENESPLPYVSIYLENTTTGTVTNESGEFELPLERGEHTLIFQFIGFEKKSQKINYENKPLTLNITMKESAIKLGTLDVSASAEDPAYPIIRKAIKKRKYYKELVEEFECNVYIKGNVKVLEAPEKIMGQEVGDMGGSLDSTRQGIVYLSESVSEFHFRQPNDFKEIMISSKVSGSDNGFSFNSAQDMDIDLYRNFTDYGRAIISPIADGAMNHYKYRLEGATVDEDGRIVHKIATLPKRKEAPVYQGYIYIVDGLWNLQQTDVFITGAAVQMPLFDTLFIKQNYVPVAEPDVWRLFSQTFSMRGGAFSFRFGGDFTGIYTDYNLNPEFPENHFGNAIMKVEEGSNEKDSIYWEEERPVPLTEEEATDYHRRDSIRIVRESKTYLDSVDQEKNKFEVGDLLFGYTWRNSWKRKSFTYEMPLATVQFNAVQGLALDLDFSFEKDFDKLGNKNIDIGGKLNYGFAEEKFRASGKLTYNYDPKFNSRIRFTGGQELKQFNEAEPISTMLNTQWSLFSHQHNIRLYDKKYFKVDWGREIKNGIYFFGVLQYAHRTTVQNNSDYSIFNKDREYEPNVPVNDDLSIPENNLLDDSKAILTGFSVRLRPGQKYFDYPDRKYIIGSKFPDIWIHYRKGIPLNPGTSNSFRSDVDFDRVAVAIQKRGIKMGLVGLSSFRLVGGTFINDERVFFQDYKHFLGNEISLNNQNRYLYGYKRLPYYEFSTRGGYAEAHWEHNFQGFFLDKVPLIRKLGWKLVAGANFLYTDERKDYMEFSLGVDNVGVGIVRLLRFDVVSSFMGGEYDGTGILFGINLPIGDLDI